MDAIEYENGLWYPHQEQKRDIFQYGYQKHKYDAALRYVNDRSNSVMLDIGAHIGLFSLYGSFDFKEVFAFEPYRPSYAALVMNTLNIPNVYTFNTGITDTDKKVRFAVPEGDATTLGGVRESTEGQLAISFSADVLNALLWSVPRIGFVKIDTEGSEAAVCKTLVASGLLLEQRPVLLVEQKQNTDALEYLQNWGYSVVQEITGDYILIAPEVR